MKKAEWNFFKFHLDKNKTVLEYGSGNSTLCIAALVSEIYSIEHDKTWYNKVQNMIKHHTIVYLNYVQQDLPRSKPTKRNEFNTYINWIKNQSISFDIVLLDGRARQWCAESVLCNLNEEHAVFLHDYDLSKRPYYERVLDFYTITDTCHTMVKMQAKK